MADWARKPFATLLKEPVRNGIYKTKEFHGRGCKIVNMGELFAHSRMYSVPMKRVELNESEQRRFLLEAGDLIFARRSLTAEGAGKCSVVLEVSEPTTFESSIIRARPDPNLANSEFLFYFFSSLQGYQALDTIRRQVAVAGITGGDLSQLQIPVPPVPTQNSIADALSLFDRKIELNRRMNETLEGMAQAIFRDWFVDFGPTRRKAAGEVDPVTIMGGLTPDPARAAELASLFPAAFGDNGLPVGWAYIEIGDLVKPQGGSTPSTSDESLWSPGIHQWATPKDLSTMSDLALFETGRQISDAGLAKITSGLLPVGSVLLSSRAPIGYLAIAQTPVAINQGFIGLVPTAEFGSPYLYCWCKANMDKIVANANGSTFQEISKRNFRPITSAVPADRRVVAEFGQLTVPLFERLIAAAKENRTLAETRDYLLPRLMSGEVRVAPSQGERA